MDLIELNPFPSVAANARSAMTTSELIGQSVHGLVFEMGGTFTKAQLSNIRIGFDGKALVDGITGQQIQEVNDYNGLPDVTNYLYVWFGDPTARTVRGQHLGDIDFSIYQKPLTIEADIGGATSPTLKVHAITGVPKMDMGIGFNEVEAARFRAFIRTVLTPNAAVTRQSHAISLGAQAGARLRALHFFHANLTSVELKKQGLVKWDDVPVALNSSLAQQFARVPAAGQYVLDRVVDGNQGEAETTVRPDNGQPWNMLVSISTSGSDTINTFADVIANYPQL